MGNSSNGTTGSNGNIVDLPASEQHRLLAVERRRLALEILAGRTTPVDLEVLAAEHAAFRAASSTVDEKTGKRIVMTPHHNHRPKLADAGVLKYDLEPHWIDPGG